MTTIREKVIAEHPDDTARRVTGKRLHVVHGVLSLELGGLERLVVDLVKIGGRRRQRVSVVCVEKPGRLAGAARELGAEVLSLDKPSGRSAAAVELAAELLRQLQPDVVHTHQIGALWYLGQAARQLGGMAVVHTEHSDHVMQAKGWWNKVQNRLRWQRMGRLTQRFCCVSEDVARAVRRWRTVPSGKVHVVLNGIDTELYEGRSRREEIRAALGIPPDARVIGTVGRLTEVKRQDLLIRGFSQLLPQVPDAWLLIVGDGNERERLESLAGELRVKERIIFAGFQAQPQWFLQAMDVFALTSRHEGLPLALLEAWAAGLPVVSSAVGGVPKVVEHEQTGLLFPNGNEGALVEGLWRLLSDEALVARLAEAGQAIVRERYSLSRMADDYERHYQASLSCPCRGQS
jgi:glycosyltransferase involved in cell wall biosynthesis